MKFCIWLTLAFSVVSSRQEQLTLSYSFQLHHNATIHQNAALLSTNLQNSDDFFVCDSGLFGMDGHYVLQPPDVIQSDLSTPVYLREDDGKFEAFGTDFRLYRHNGFWLIANVEAWPPETHFRCDPTKSQAIGVDVSEACRLGQLTPPRVGYSPANPRFGEYSLTLHRHACRETS